MIRKTRSDCTVGSLEKKCGLPTGTIRNKNGRKTRKDKLVGTIRKENKKKCFQKRKHFFYFHKTSNPATNAYTLLIFYSNL